MVRSVKITSFRNQISSPEHEKAYSQELESQGTLAQTAGPKFAAWEESEEGPSEKNESRRGYEEEWGLGLGAVDGKALTKQETVGADERDSSAAH